MRKHHVAAAFKRWLPLAFLTTALCMLVYAAVQQDYRQSANDPQIQLAEDAATAVGGGAAAATQSLSFEGNVDIGISLSPYLVFYSDAGVPTGGNGLLNGKFPTLPQSLFDYVRATGETSVTWQPQPGLRQAIVVTRIGGSAPGFVMAGRSLREVEIRENGLGLVTFVTWTVTLIGLFLILLGLELISRRESR
jgi:hypothetical protein